MSSGISHEKCPQCGGVYVYQTECGQFLEEYTRCNRCGKSTELFVKRDSSGKPVLDDAGNVVWINNSKDGYGCIAIAKERVTVVYDLAKPVDEEIKKEYLETLEEEGVIKDKCYLSSWDEEKKEIVAIFGTLPKSYDELEANSESDTD